VLAVGQSNSDNANMTRTPNAASVALIEKDRVLLIQRNRTPYFGMWSLPGGRLEPGETAETAAVREVREETGLTCFRLTPVRRMLLAEGRFALQVFATEGFEGRDHAVGRDCRLALGAVLGACRTRDHAGSGGRP
jgi:8-oxo-dGTP pyrophosphatase MutT (NUDIX family)